VSDQKDNTQDTSKNTKFAKQPIVENLSTIGKTNALLNPVTSNSVSSQQKSKGVNNNKVIAPGMFRINPSKTSREEKQVPNTVFQSSNIIRNIFVLPVSKEKAKEHLIHQSQFQIREAARTMLIFSRAPLFLWAEAIATACFTQNCSIIHRRFNKTSYELINGRKPDISFLHVFGALCYPKDDREDIGKLGAKGDIGFSLDILLIPVL
nr:retrovirus-related Pol polyprotein from transposon TNT 1-94 [Tanacetum cinerariifolium]